jgi:Tetratricopeptide repeat
MTQAIDRLDFSDVHTDEPNAAEEYRALVRALRRKRGFGLFFVQASPAMGQEILADLQRDLPGKRVAEVTIGRTDDRLFEQLDAVWERGKVDIFWVEGLEQSLLGYEDMQRLAGWSEQDLLTYSWKDVPPILSHLNLGRERFEAQYDCAVVFVVPLFVVKYLLRRAGDFFDWKSGFFELPDDRQTLTERMIKDADYDEYLKLDAIERLEKILKIKDLLSVANLEVDRRAYLLREIGRLFDVGKDYEQAIFAFDQAIKIKPDFSAAWNNKGLSLVDLGRYEEAVAAYKRAIDLDPKGFHAYENLGNVYAFHGKSYKEAIESYQRAVGATKVPRKPVGR